MLANILRRLVTVIPTLIGVVIVTFLLTRVLPGDPAVYFAGPTATPESIAEVRKSLGLQAGALRAQVIEVDTEAVPGDPDRTLLHFDASDRSLTGYAWDFTSALGDPAQVGSGDHYHDAGVGTCHGPVNK